MRPLAFLFLALFCSTVAFAQNDERRTPSDPGFEVYLHAQLDFLREKIPTLSSEQLVQIETAYHEAEVQLLDHMQQGGRRVEVLREHPEYYHEADRTVKGAVLDEPEEFVFEQIFPDLNYVRVYGQRPIEG